MRLAEARGRRRSRRRASASADPQGTNRGGAGAVRWTVAECCRDWLCSWRIGPAPRGAGPDHDGPMLETVGDRSIIGRRLGVD